MSEEQNTDFEIHIHKSTTEGEYPVTVYVAGQDRRAEGVFRSPFQQAEVNRALSWMEQGLFDEEFVRQFGSHLFQALFQEQVKEVYVGARQGAPATLRLRLIVDEPEIARIPWELLYDPERSVFLALEFPLVRGASLIEPARPIEAAACLRVLVADAFPLGVPRLENQIETDSIRKALAELERQGRVEIETVSHLTLRSLQDRLREAADPQNPRPFHVLHFIGHGQYEPNRGQSTLLFEDEAGQIDEVDPETLANILRPYDLKLVFLNACQSLQASTLDIAQGFAPALMGTGIPAVIGMQVTVMDEVARQFARDFYESLADNRPVDAALTDARRLLRGDRKRRKADLGIPVGYLRSASGKILEIPTRRATPLTLHTWRPWLREQARPRQVAAVFISFITLASSLLGLYLGVREVFFRPGEVLPPMTGDFRIAVAQFSVLNGQGEAGNSREGHEFAQEVYQGIDGAMQDLRQAGFDVTVRSPEQTGVVEGADPGQRAERASRLADELDADLIIYGSLQNEAGGTDARLEFVLTRRLLLPSEEIAGAHQWAPERVPDNVHENPVARKMLRDLLSGNVKVLTQLVIGIGYYKLDQFQEAARYFQGAAQMENIRAEMKLLVLLFQGSTAAQEGDFPLARSLFDQALEIRPDYGRARLAIANTIAISQIRTGCVPEKMDAAVLAQAEQEYQKVRASPQVANTDLPALTALGLARISLCASIAGLGDRWQEARREYGLIVQEYEAGNSLLRDLASEAHADLGLLDTLQPPAPDYLSAVGEYTRAIEISPHQDRQAVFYTHLANTQLALGACEQSKQALEKAGERYAHFLQENPHIRREDFESFQSQINEKWLNRCGS